MEISKLIMNQSADLIHPLSLKIYPTNHQVIFTEVGYAQIETHLCHHKEKYLIAILGRLRHQAMTSAPQNRFYLVKRSPGTRWFVQWHPPDANAMWSPENTRQGKLFSCVEPVKIYKPFLYNWVLNSQYLVKHRKSRVFCRLLK